MKSDNMRKKKFVNYIMKNVFQCSRIDKSFSRATEGQEKRKNLPIKFVCSYLESL